MFDGGRPSAVTGSRWLWLAVALAAVAGVAAAYWLFGVLSG
jgi:hypothetical protein